RLVPLARAAREYVAIRNTLGFPEAQLTSAGPKWRAVFRGNRISYVLHAESDPQAPSGFLRIFLGLPEEWARVEGLFPVGRALAVGWKDPSRILPPLGASTLA